MGLGVVERGGGRHGVNEVLTKIEVHVHECVFECVCVSASTGRHYDTL